VIPNIRKLLAGVSIALAAASTLASPAAQVLPSTEKTRREIVKLATAIEANPLAKESRRNRQKALQIIEISQDLRLRSCRALLGELSLSRKLGAMELRAHLSIAAACYLADHPDASGSDVRTAVAGLEGVVRAYASMRRADLRIAIPEADDLAARYERGELEAYAADALANCDR